MNPLQRNFLALFLILALLFTATAPARAEDAPPPPPAQNPDGSPSASSSAPPGASDSEQPAARPAEYEAAPAVSIPHPPNTTPEGITAAGVGSFSGETLVSASGNPVPEGTDLAAQAVGWVYACAPGTKPTFLGGTCILHFDTLQAAIYGAGSGWTVWAEDYFSDTANVVVDRPLTIQGSALRPMSVGTVGIWPPAIHIKSYNVTLRDMNVNGMVYSDLYAGTLRLQNVRITSPNWYALAMDEFMGSVVLSNVTAVGSKLGTLLMMAEGTGTLSIFNSAFDRTGDQSGLEIASRNAVKLENVTSSDNYGSGLYVEYARSLTIKNSQFNRNYNSSHAAPPVYDPEGDKGHGISAHDLGTTPGVVLLRNVSAITNGENGLAIFNAGSTSLSSSVFNANIHNGLFYNGFGSITIDGSNFDHNSGSTIAHGALIFTQGSVSINSSSFNENEVTGLYVSNPASISLKHSQASGNGVKGADLENAIPTSLSGVSVSNGIFNNNTIEGLYIRTRGTVTLSGITAMHNGNPGQLAAFAVDVDNCLSMTSCTGFGSVTLSSSLGANLISYNVGSGLGVNSKGSVSLAGLNAADNGNTGTEIYNYLGSGNVTITSSNFDENGNPADPVLWMNNGLFVDSNGNISLDRVSAVRNVNTGIELKNNHAAVRTVSAKNITVGSNGLVGLNILSKGSVTINHLKAFENSHFALSVDNTFGTTAGVSIQNTLGSNLVSDNGWGVEVWSNGTISVTGLIVTGTHLWGAKFNNSLGTGAGVSISSSKFNDNDGDGLEVDSKGSITLSSVQASGNRGIFGANLLNDYLAGKSITVYRGNFDRNASTGLMMAAGGTVTIDGISASDNGRDGLMISNQLRGAYNVNILSTLGANLFNNNRLFSGVTISTAGNVAISRASANGHSLSGFEINMYGSRKTITLTCASANANWRGLDVITHAGPVKVYLKGSSFTGNSDQNWSATGGSQVVYTAQTCP